MTEQKISKNSILVVENRNALTLTGVEKVIAFSPTQISLVVQGCTMHIQGEQLYTEKIDVESGEFKVEGLICIIKWENKKEKIPFFKRIFR